jgi:hypothetical protein
VHFNTLNLTRRGCMCFLLKARHSRSAWGNPTGIQMAAEPGAESAFQFGDGSQTKQLNDMNRCGR